MTGFEIILGLFVLPAAVATLYIAAATIHDAIS